VVPLVRADQLPSVVNATVAQTWARAGLAIVPWRLEVHGTRRRKRPTLSGWTNGSALRTPEACAEHWRSQPMDYPGVVTGDASGVWVLDLDQKNGVDGVAAFQELVRLYGGNPEGKLPDSYLKVKTPSGGWHVYFKMHPGLRNSQGKVAPGIDVRANGGFVAAPGTVLHDGRAYTEPGAPLDWLEAPEWLLSLALAAPAAAAWDGPVPAVESAEALAAARPGEQDGKLFGYLAGQHRRGAQPEQALAAAWQVVQGWELGDPSDPWTYEDVQAKVRSIWAREEYRGTAAPVEPWMRDVADRFAGLTRSVVRPEVLPASVEVQREVTAAALEQAIFGDDLSDETAVMPDGYRASDSGNARRLVALAEGRVRYVHAWHKWLVYLDGRWVLDHGDVLMQRWAKEVARSLFRRAGDDTLDSAHREALVKFGLRSESIGHLTAMIRAARDLPGILVEHDQLDADPWLLNCLNGTVDLRTGELRTHDPLDLLTMQAPVAYDPAARSELWERVVAEWLPDPAVRAFLQRAVGSAASGIAVQALIVNHGLGSNGKSTFFKLVNLALGSFCVQPDDSLIVQTRTDPHPTVKASLFRARMLLVAETQAGARLNEQQVKLLTGGDLIRARRMREDEWSFEPTHTAFMHTNHEPRIKGTDEGIWRRVKLVPWTVTIPPERRDPELEHRLRTPEHLEAVLAWVVAGCVEWHSGGLDLGEPAAVLEATERFRGRSDTVAAFLAETGITLAPGAWVTTAELAEVHRSWVVAAGVGVDEGAHWKLVTTVLRERGVEARVKKIGGVATRVWWGAGLTEAEALVDQEEA
jgi:putative DNA primase/helicase